MAYRKEDKPHLQAFAPGHGRNTILRLAANALGIPLIDERADEPEKPFNAMPENGQTDAAPEWMRILNPAAGPQQTFSQPQGQQPQTQYAQFQPEANGRKYHESVTKADIALAESGSGSLLPAPQRPFREDFPRKNYNFDPETGRMMTDVDGRPINPDAVVVGRAYENQPDVPLSDADADKVIEQLTGKPVQYGNISDGYGGKYEFAPFQDKPGIMHLRNDVIPELNQRIKRHELGHVFDHIGGSLWTKFNSMPSAVRGELFPIYNEQRNKEYNIERLYNPKVKPGDIPDGKGRNHTPSKDNYEEITYYDALTDRYLDVERAELVAEAFYAYLKDPNTMKARFPNAARYFRDLVNTNPELNKYIHLSDNSGNRNSNPYFPFAKQSKNT